MFSFFHISKTGGTAIRALLQADTELNPERSVTVFGHHYTLKRILEERPHDDVLFFVREPVERFVSGFNSRKRNGRPRYYTPWSDAEQAAYQMFEEPNDLAEALSSRSMQVRRATADAVAAISHMRYDFRHSFHSVEYLQSVRDRIAFIGATKHLDDDVPRLKEIVGIAEELEYPTDDFGAHRTPRDMNVALSKRGRKNVEEWYAADRAIYDWCLERRRQILERM